MMQKTILLGAHMSIAGGLSKSIERAIASECTTMQIFTKSNKSWQAKPLGNDEIHLFKKTLKESNLQKIMAHSSYLINLGSSNSIVREKSIASLGLELNRCQELEIPYLILHPGAHTGAGEKVGIQRISQGLDEVYEKYPSQTMILLETAAGQGTNIGFKPEQIKSIIEGTKVISKLGVCIDTCHIFAAGYDISTDVGYDQFFEEFEKHIPFEKLKAIHLNDSKTPLGSKKDRHEKIGKGHIPLETFKRILSDSRLKDVPKVLETPFEDDPILEYKEEIQLLKNLLG